MELQTYENNGVKNDQSFIQTVVADGDGGDGGE
jgi:hypothetical protein